MRRLPAQPTLTAGDLTLRPFEVDDAPALVEIWRDPTIRRRNHVPEPNERAALTWVAERHAMLARGEGAEWAIVDTDSGRLAGRRAIKPVDWSARRAGAGAWIAGEFRGRRLAPRSLRLAARYVFAAWGIERLQAECDVDNYASYRSLLAAGMRHEGVSRGLVRSQDGTGRTDQHVFGLLAADLA